MLDSDTKRRIDTARDILVGKVPDPKSQVEQITIALIYKFMDDMDAEAEELGGKRSFFVGEYKKFSWAKLLSPTLSGFEMLSLYMEAVEKMTRNQGVPQLFRDIFKNAYLPYRDPETLRLFLKTINEFTYDHSERLGDAFEYLLSVLGSQGDAGQFRTPRHIIDFMVKVVDPHKDDTILDPACGTAGFLISAYKHVMACNEKGGRAGGALKPSERKRLADNIRGYDISPDMVRLSLVNLYLHGFATPNIFEYDTLTSEERWNEYADVILANPPFMSPKGGIKPHKHFSVQSNRSEVLFVDYMVEHLTPNGRAAIIVPEGIIFQSAGAYKHLRKYLIENSLLWAVVSLPQGMFNPYAGVKTSILFLDKVLARKTDQILFVKVEADGFDFGAQRKPIERNDLPETLEILNEYKQTLRVSETLKVLTVPVSKLAESGDYNLSADRYREVIRVGKQTYEMVSLENFIELSGERVGKSIDIPVMSITMNYGLIDQGEKFKRRIASHDIAGYKLVRRNEMVVGFPIDEGVIGFQKKYDAAAVSPAYDIWKLKKGDINLDYLEIILRSDHARQLYRNRMQGTAGRRRSLAKSDFLDIEVPLPPLEMQRQITEEIAAHQQIIDGARQVVDVWKQNLELELVESLPDGFDEWAKVKLGDVCEVRTGKLNSNAATENGKYPFFTCSKEIFRIDTFAFDCEAILLSGNNASGNFDVKRFKGKFNAYQRTYVITIKDEYADKLDYRILQTTLENNLASLKHQSIGGLTKYLKLDMITSIEISLPPLEIQREIVARIERERAIVEGNQELIRLYEEKVKKVIERVWEG